MPTSPGLLTDRYELTMLASFVTDGSAEHPAVFEAFARRLPEGRRYGVLAGLGRLLPLIADFSFADDEVAWLLDQGVVDPATAAYLRDFRFTGDVDAYREGDLYFPGSPILTVRGTLGECVLLETLVLSVLNHDSAIASAAARMVLAAGGTADRGGRPLVEMGSRRTHEQAAVAVARAAYVAGFATTSNLAAGIEHGVPTVGTAAHAFTLAYPTEAEAFASQVAAQGVGTTLLVDTYDTAAGIRTAVEVAGPRLGAIRIDSGDLAEESGKARALLDELGATGTRIIVTSDLDEYVLAALADAPIDGYGVGTRVATGSGHPTASMVYKLVAVGQEPGGAVRAVAKRSHDKVSVGGRKTAWRRHDDGVLIEEWYVTDPTDPGARAQDPTDGAVEVQVPAVRGGVVVHAPSLDEIRAHCASALGSLPSTARSVAAGTPYLTVGPRPVRTRPQPRRAPMTATTPSPQPTPSTQAARRALVIVDVQNDFVEGGSLAVTGGLDVAAAVSRHLEATAGSYAAVIASRDWHDPASTNGGHFHVPGEQPDYATTWPVHCVSSEHGSDYAPGLDLTHVTHHVRKGMGAPAYSAFEGVTDDGTTLASVLHDLGVTAVDVVGIATDHCVRATVLDARAAGLEVTLLPGLHAGVAEETSRAALAEMRAAGAVIR